MRTSWPIVKLSEILEQRLEYENIEANIKYKLVGVRLEGKGPFIREEKIGNEISAKKLNRLYEGDFIYSRLFAWRGAFGIITESLQGAYVSNEFPTFIINRNKLYPRFLELYFNQKYIWDVVEIYCTGTTKASRNRFKEKFFLEFEIPLPPIEEQKRIVEKINFIVKKVEEVRALREEAIKEAEEFFNSELNKVMESIEGKIINFDEIFKICSGKGLNQNQRDESGSYKVYGSNGVIGFHTQYLVEYPTIVIGRKGSTGKLNMTDGPSWPIDTSYYVIPYDSINLKYLYYLLLSKKLDAIVARSPKPGISSKDIYNIKVNYIQDINVQQQIVSYLDSLQDKIFELKKLQVESEKEIEQLIPSILDKAFKGELKNI